MTVRHATAVARLELQQAKIKIKLANTLMHNKVLGAHASPFLANGQLLVPPNALVLASPNNLHTLIHAN